MNLQEKIQANTIELFNSFNNLDQTSLELKPGENVWSILEILEHVFLIDKAVLKALTAPAPIEETDKTPNELFGEQKIHKLLVERRNFKVPAPDFSNPSGRFTTIEDAKQNINSIIDRIVNHINSNTITEETHTIKHLVLGEMTKIDWVHFLISHTNRHILQIEEVKGILI
jgi:DinB superfamily